MIVWIKIMAIEVVRDSRFFRYVQGFADEFFVMDTDTDRTIKILCLNQLSIFLVEDYWKNRFERKI